MQRSPRVPGSGRRSSATCSPRAGTGNARDAGLPPAVQRSAVARRARGLAALLTCIALGRTNLAQGAPTIEFTSARFGSVFTTDEVPFLTVTIGAGADALRGRLVVTATDAYGRRAGRESMRVRLRPGDVASRTISLRRRRLGWFVIDARVVERSGVTTSATTTAGIVPPVDASSPEASGVGYFVLPTDDELPRAHEIAAEMRRFGIRWVRLQFYWNLDGRRDRPDLTGPDWLDTSSFEHWVDAFAANGIGVVGVLFGSARWASSAADQDDAGGGLPRWAVAPPLEADWTLFVRTIAERLRGRVRDWEVWNEPDIPVFWVGTAEDYVPLARSAAAVLRSVDPGVRVVRNLVNRSPEGIAFTDTVLAGAGDVFDAFGSHYGTADARDFMSFLRPGAAIWDTEAHGVPRRQISRWLAERAMGVERIFPFVYPAMIDDAVWTDALRFGQYPVNLDYTPRPDAIALRTLSDMVGSATLLAADAAGLGYGAYRFVGPAGEVVALADGNEIGATWSPETPIALLLQVPPDVRRVTAVDLMGNRRVLRAR